MVNVKDVKLGKNTRKSFAKINEVLEMPNLIEVQKNSYQWFLDEGLKEVFRDVSAITDYNGTLELTFVGYHFDEEAKYSVAECKARDVTYAVPLRVTARLNNTETGEIKEQEIFMGDFPLMTAELLLSTAQSVLSFLSWCVHQVFITLLIRTRPVRICSRQLLSLTEALGLNMKWILTMWFMSE